jgi:membrane protein implicated in regulation of membrane protease activity
MRLAAATIYLSSGLLVATSAPGVDLPGWDTWLLQGGSFAVLVFVLVRLMTKVIPDLEASLRHQAEAHQKAVDAIVRAFAEESNRSRAEHLQQVEHYAEVIRQKGEAMVKIITSKQRDER